MLCVESPLVTTPCVFIENICKADRIENIRGCEPEKDLSIGGKPEGTVETPPIFRMIGQYRFGISVHFLQGSAASLSQICYQSRTILGWIRKGLKMGHLGAIAIRNSRV